jgi:predicted metal-dependent hydrolase
MKKSDRIHAFVNGLEIKSDSSLDPRYQGYFTCFNEGRYYEAHDVLEDLWLETKDEHYLFYKGLIQVAGAFVHLQKQYLRPNHPKDGRRLHPAVRLFRLAASNLAAYGDRHLGIDLSKIRDGCKTMADQIEATQFTHNPWSPETAPQLAFPK